MIRFRRGLDARNVPPPIRVPGEQSRDRNALLAKLAELMKDESPAFKVAMLFVDSAFGAPYVERLHALGFANVIEVNFVAPSSDRHRANMRAYMWNLRKGWLLRGAISADDGVLSVRLRRDLVTLFLAETGRSRVRRTVGHFGFRPG